MTTTDEQSLLRAILADPGDDTVRLAYADWLDENAPLVVCRKCDGYGGYKGFSIRHQRHINRLDCPKCRNAGYISHPMNDRAEFIRVQVELAREPHCVNCGGKGWMGYGSFTETCKWCRPAWLSLRRRERELLDDPHPVGNYRIYSNRMGWAEDIRQHCKYEFSHGFVSHVTTTAAVFLGRPCRGCRGTGSMQIGTAAGVSAGRSDCPICNGTGHTEGIARAVFAAHPVTSVTLSDREPYHADNKWSWVKWVPGQPEELRPDDPLESAAIGRRLWDHIEGHTNPGGGVLKWFPTADAALAALSAACCRYGRALAGLPALPPGQPNPAS